MYTERCTEKCTQIFLFSYQRDLQRKRKKDFNLAAEEKTHELKRRRRKKMINLRLYSL